MQNPSIAFIGAGNMATSIIGGLLAKDASRGTLSASDPSEQALERLKASMPVVKTSVDNNEAINKANVIVLAVKPQVMEAVARDIADTVQQTKPLVISIAAGIEITSLDQWLGGNTAIVRCMPNTPALVGMGATALFANQHVEQEQKQLAHNILRSVGVALWVEEEKQLDAVTAVSGSGPAYFFLVMEAMQQAGENLGLSPENAKLLTLQTALGSAQMAITSDVDTAELRRRVTSPAGTTEKAIESFEAAGLREMFEQAMIAARDRSEELAKALGDN